MIERIAELTGNEIYRCYQCQKCSSGCPFAQYMDFPPAVIIRMIHFGMKEKLLSSETIWVCASCETCTTRCPNEIDIAHIMDALRQECVREGFKPAGKNVYLFHSAFMSSIKSYGRVHELGMLGKYKLKSGNFFDDLKLGYDMYKKGKIKLFPHKIKGMRDIKKIFKKIIN